MIRYLEAGPECGEVYDRIEMKAKISQIYQVEFRDLEGIAFHKVPVTPCEKDFAQWERFSLWEQQFDLSNWHFFLALDGERPVGGAVLCHHTPGMQMLEGREDLGVLWDLRVEGSCQRQGIGSRLFQMATQKAKELGLSQMKIECQNNNLPAVDFYLRQGAHLGAVNRYAYWEDGLEQEVQLLMYLDLVPPKP